MSGRGAGRAAWLALVLGLGCGGEVEDPEARRSLREATVTAEVRSRLLAVPRLERLPLTVDTRGETVRVRGEVHDSTQVAAVRAIVEAVRGVERVELDVRVVPPPPDSTAAAPPAPAPAPAESLPPLEEAG